MNIDEPFRTKRLFNYRKIDMKYVMIYMCIYGKEKDEKNKCCNRQ